MSTEQTNVVDFVSIDPKSGDVWLTISDHLPWDQDEGEPLFLLQEKLNAYLRFIESGQMYEERPDTKDQKVIIDLVGKFPLSKQAGLFFEKARALIHNAGFKLQFRLLRCSEDESGDSH
jgi:hypothetical protein